MFLSNAFTDQAEVEETDPTMTEISSSAEADEPLVTLRRQLQRLHRESGEPSTREIARRSRRSTRPLYGEQRVTVPHNSAMASGCGRRCCARCAH
jgi:hypothetical protein